MLHKVNKIQSLNLDGEESYQIEMLNEGQLKICDQNISIKSRIQTITVNYDHCLMSGFQFRKLYKNIQYRWFKINTINRKLINGDWLAL